MDPRQTRIDIQGSPLKLIGLVVLGIIMTGLSGAIALGYIPVAAGGIRQFFGWAGLLFFGAALAIGFYRFATVSKIVVTLSPDGLHDIRVSERPVPWEAIADVGVWTMHEQNIIVLAVPPDVEARIGLTRMARWSRGANAKLGADGLCISATGLKIGHKDLLDEIRKRMAAVGETEFRTA
mgnify:FL=1